ncbi:MAG: hypothetical protein H0W68_11215, partial [Gemmatimonadaceae bacterium]|nr:hypothetical protein [Gemmatimonadaceae bacterium]
MPETQPVNSAERLVTWPEERADAMSLALILSLGLSAAYAVQRAGLGVPWWLIAQSLGMSALIQAAPSVWPSVPGGEGDRAGGSRFDSDAARLLAGAVALIALAACSRAFGFPLGPLTALAGLAMAVRPLARWWRAASAQRRSIVSVGVLLAMWGADAIWSQGYLAPLLLEDLAATGYANQDTLFHVAISRMLQTYGRVTTGVDGVSPLTYYVGSHWLLSRWADLTGAPVLDTYRVAYPVVLVPLFVRVLAGASSALRRVLHETDAAATPPVTGWPWLTGAGLVGLTPLALRSRLPLWPVVNSESHLIALVVALLALWLLLDAWRAGLVTRVRAGDVGGGAGIVAALLLGCIVAMGWLKVSVMLMFVLGLGYVALRTVLWRSALPASLLVIGSIVSLLTYRAVSPPALATNLRTGDFFVRFVPPTLVPIFVAAVYG